MKTLQELQATVQALFASLPADSQPATLYDPIHYTLSLGGKRIRPLLLLAANDLCGGNLEQASDAAIGIEVFHNFTLLHDDLMDRSPLRRGQPTVYRKWNENTAVLSGDTMFALAWQHLLRRPHTRLQDILQTFNRTAIEVCEGQQYDMDFETRTDVSLDDYLHMIRLKTAVLLACALKLGALYAQAPDKEVETLYQIGLNLGLAFQLQDDLLDAYGDTSTFGKQTGTDISDNKKTYLLLRALEAGDAEQRATLRKLFSCTPQDPEPKVATVLDIYDRLHIRPHTEQAIASYIDQAHALLRTLPQSDADKEPLRQIMQSLVNRNR